MPVVEIRLAVKPTCLAIHAEYDGQLRAVRQPPNVRRCELGIQPPFDPDVTVVCRLTVIPMHNQETTGVDGILDIPRPTVPGEIGSEQFGRKRFAIPVRSIIVVRRISVWPREIDAIHRIATPDQEVSHLLRGLHVATLVVVVGVVILEVGRHHSTGIEARIGWRSAFVVDDLVYHGRSLRRGIDRDAANGQLRVVVARHIRVVQVSARRRTGWIPAPRATPGMHRHVVRRYELRISEEQHKRRRRLPLVIGIQDVVADLIRRGPGLLGGAHLGVNPPPSLPVGQRVRLLNQTGRRDDEILRPTIAGDAGGGRRPLSHLPHLCLQNRIVQQ